MRTLTKAEIRRVRGGVECGPANAATKVKKKGVARKLSAIAKKVCGRKKAT